MKAKVWVLSLLLVSCAVTERASEAFFRIDRENKTSKSGLSFNGAYQRITNDFDNHPTEYLQGKPTRTIAKPYLVYPVFFFDNGLVCSANFLSLDSANFSYNMSTYGQSKRSAYNWGVYSVSGDTIEAIIYFRFNVWGGVRRKQCRFRGVIKNDQQIVDWHMVPPYPREANLDVNGGLLLDQTAPRYIQFKAVPVETLIDPKKVWINKLRKN